MLRKRKRGEAAIIRGAAIAAVEVEVVALIENAGVDAHTTGIDHAAGVEIETVEMAVVGTLHHGITGVVAPAVGDVEIKTSV